LAEFSEVSVFLRALFTLHIHGTRIARMTTASSTAIALVRIGTVPFIAYTALFASVSLDLVSVPLAFSATVRLALVCHAGIILAFIGGLQQAAVVAMEVARESSPSEKVAAAISSSGGSALVAASIAIAICACAAALGAATRGATALEPLGLSVAYGCQLSIESFVLPCALRRIVLADARRVPMLIASLSLTACAVDASVEPPVLAACAAAMAALVTALHSLASMEASSAPAAERPLFGAVAVGTTNPCKLSAVRAALARYPEVAAARGTGTGAETERGWSAHKVASGVSEQPMSLEETARGARNRAAAAHAAAVEMHAAAVEMHAAAVEMHAGARVPRAGGSATTSAAAADGPVLALGIESGLFALEYDGRRRYYDVCVVSAYDGARHHLGLSCAFEIPQPILRHVLEEGMDLSQACNVSAITTDPKIGEHGGLIGLLSSSRITREEYTVQALNTALFFAAAAARPWYAD
jgi:non-canonical (house-cleaning) NTP pyrophosphatase